MLFKETKPFAWKNVAELEGARTRVHFVLRESRKLARIDEASRTAPKLLN